MGELITKEMLFVKNDDGQMIISPSAIEDICILETQIKRMNKEYKKYKAALLAGMEAYGLKKCETDDLLVTYVEPTERIDIDRDKLWAEYRDIAFKCQKDVPVKSSIRITVR